MIDLNAEVGIFVVKIIMSLGFKINGNNKNREIDLIEILL